MRGYWGPLARLVEWPKTGGPDVRGVPKAAGPWRCRVRIRIWVRKPRASAEGLCLRLPPCRAEAVR